MVWVPPQYQRETEEFRKELMDSVVRSEMLRVKNVLDEYTYELKKIDPLLELVRAPADVGTTGLKAHYYTVIRWNEGAPPAFFIHEGPNGEFREPDSGLFERMKRSDLWDPANMRRLKQRDARLDEAEARFLQRAKEDRREELMDRVNAATRTQVSMNRDVPWTQNISPASQRERGAKQRKKAG